MGACMALGASKRASTSLAEISVPFANERRISTILPRQMRLGSPRNEGSRRLVGVLASICPAEAHISCTGQTVHAEAIEIEFDEDVISYEQLIEVFWVIHDPTSLNRQGNDVGTQYRSAIFYLDNIQKEIAEKSKTNALNKFDKPIVTEIVKATKFFVAEDYHQNFYNKNQNYGYCQFIISPKLDKFKKQFKEKLV